MTFSQNSQRDFPVSLTLRSSSNMAGGLIVTSVVLALGCVYSIALVSYYWSKSNEDRLKFMVTATRAELKREATVAYFLQKRKASFQVWYH